MAFSKIPDKGLQLLFGSHQNLHQKWGKGAGSNFFLTFTSQKIPINVT